MWLNFNDMVIQTETIYTITLWDALKTTFDVLEAEEKEINKVKMCGIICDYELNISYSSTYYLLSVSLEDLGNY